MTRPLPQASRVTACVLALCTFGTVHAAVTVHTVNVDLTQKIDVAVAKRERFAVDIPHAASSATTGSWQRADGQSIWRYAVRIPTAVSMSFHAGSFRLPGGASLTVSGTDGTRFTYTGTDGGRGELWSRVHRGDTLTFELRVSSALESQVDLALTSVQAGYRGIGGGAPDHPHFRKLQVANTAAAAAVCTENFACHANAANGGNGDATAAIVIGGVALCSATLVNNLRNDATGYLLSARHCQDTHSSGIVVYWDAVTPCGTPLGTVYDTQTPAYVHTTDTVFEQQDVWLIRLSGPVNGNRVYFAGWDATGSTFIGGYAPHHALGRSRQYTQWFGQAAQQTLSGSTLGVGYESTYWGVVNSVGNVGSGASGGGLFNSDHRLVGTASLADLIGNQGEGVCPAASPPAPSSSTATALYNSLAAVWETNADTTSFTNPITLKSLLDPDNTGARVANGFEMLAGVYLTSNPYFGDTGRTITLSWGGGTATSCTASGGVAGDGWSGPRSASGTYEVTQYDAGLTTYTIRCTDGVRFAIRSVRVMWNLSQPSLLLSPSDSSGWLGTSIRMFWRATAMPCTASGGLAGDGWAGAKAGTGTLDLPLLQAGVARYTMICGTGPRAASQTVEVGAAAPIAMLTPATDNMRVNSQVQVMQSAGGASCTRTGGAPGDGWTEVTGSYPLRLTSAVAGTYRYTLTCYGGPNGSPAPAEATMDLTFTNDAPMATLSASPAVGVVFPAGPVADLTGASPYHVGLSWTSNVAPCQLTYDGPGAEDGNVNPAMDLPASGSWNAVGTVIGTYVFRVTCRSGNDEATATATAEFIPQPPRVQMYVDPTIARARDQPFTIHWAASISPCVASGGSPGDGWASPATATNHTPSITVTTPGTYEYRMTCGTAPDTVSSSITITVAPSMVVFEPHPAQVLTTHGVVLRWNGTVGNCVLTGDWSSTIGAYFASGSNVAYSSTPGTRTYGVRCGLSNFVEATTQVTYLPVPTVDITASVPSTTVSQPVTLSWTSTDAESCVAQGASTPEWSGVLPTSGSRVVTRSVPGTMGFYINCGDVIDAVVVEWRSITTSPLTPAAPAVNLTIDHTTRVSGEAVTLTWTTTRAASCRGSEGVSGDGWTGVLPVSGARTITVSGTGTFSWAITCDGAPPAATARVSATFTGSSPPTPPPSGGGSSSGGASGGGSLDALLLILLAKLLLLPRFARARRARIRVGRAPHG